MLRPVGEGAWLFEDTDEARLNAAWRRLRDAALAGVRDLVLGAQSVLVVPERGSEIPRERLEPLLAQAAESPDDVAPRTIEVPVRYDGPDLAIVADRAGRTVDEVVRLHAAASYRVAFLGFQPGFAYLRGLPPELATPRRSEPRTRVPRGSLAIGAGWTAIYPAESPGGWNLIGTADVTLFDVMASPPVLLSPGDRVRFVG